MNKSETRLTKVCRFLRTVSCSMTSTLLILVALMVVDLFKNVGQSRLVRLSVNPPSLSTWGRLINSENDYSLKYNHYKVSIRLQKEWNTFFSKAKKKCIFYPKSSRVLSMLRCNIHFGLVHKDRWGSIQSRPSTQRKLFQKSSQPDSLLDPRLIRYWSFICKAKQLITKKIF